MLNICHGVELERERAREREREREREGIEPLSHELWLLEPHEYIAMYLVRPLVQ